MRTNGQPFRETTLADVHAQSGPPFWLPASRKRFRVFGVSGFPIRPETRTATNTASRTSFAVLDSFDCWREVAYFDHERDAYLESARLNRLARDGP